MVNKKDLEKLNKPAQLPDGMDFDLQLFNGRIAQPATTATAPVEKDFYNLPTSTEAYIISQVIGSGGDYIDELEERHHKTSNSSSLTTKGNKSKRVILYHSKTVDMELRVEDVTKLSRAGEKLFIFALIKINEQALYDGELTRDYITFPLQELIDTEFSGSAKSARRSFKDGIEALKTISLNGEDRSNPKNPHSIVGFSPFRYGEIKNGQCYIYLEPEFNWATLAQYFTILPKYYFKLPHRASQLLLLIFMLARENARKIKEQGYFTLSFRKIQDRLQLPSETATKNPLRDIREPIEEALEKIEEEHFKAHNNGDFQFQPHYEEEWNIADFLNKGYLEIRLKGKYAESFIEQSNKRAKQIDSAKKRREKIVDSAKARNLAKKMEQEQ